MFGWLYKHSVMRKCTNCLHGKVNEVNELVCDMGREINTPQCPAFAPKNEYIEEMIKENNGRELFSYLFIVGIATIGCVFFFGCIGLFEIPDSNIFDNPYLCTLLIIGVLCLTVAGISPLALRLRRNSVKQEVRRELENEVRRELAPKLLTRNIIKNYLEQYGMSPEPIDGSNGFKFTSHDIRYAVYYEDNHNMTIRYGCTLEECDAKVVEKIIKCNDGEVFSVQRKIQEYTNDDGQNVYILCCDADFFVEYQDYFNREFSRYLHHVEIASNNIFVSLDRCKNESQNRDNSRSDLYNPEYRLIPHILQAVAADHLLPDALVDEEWIRKEIQTRCDNRECKEEWNSFKINRVENYGDYKMVVYQFPEPKIVPEAKYGVVLLNTGTEEGNYYTLEMSHDGMWYYGGVAENRHLNYGPAESADLDRFIEWIFSSNKQVVTSTDYTKE